MPVAAGDQVGRRLRRLVRRRRLEREVLLGRAARRARRRPCRRRRRRPARRRSSRHASSRVQVPRTLVSKPRTGDSATVPTIVSAARWKTVGYRMLAEHAPQQLGIAEVALEVVDLAPRSRAARASTRPLGTALVEADDLAALVEQRLRQPGADEPARTGDQRRAHQAWTPARSQIAQGAVPARPQVVEHDRVLVGVHAVPEALVAIRAQLPGRGEPRRAARARAPSRARARRGRPARRRRSRR